jgi:protein-disulfide isomerase
MAAMIALAVLALSGCAPSGSPDASGSSDSSASDSSASGALPTGTKGAVDFDNGVIALGDGATTVDTFIDPMCPYCGAFEKSSGAELASFVGDNTITLRVHPLTFLDQASQGTKYSSRASASVVCVAANDPAKTLAYLSSLFANQPEEGSKGLTDNELIAIAQKAGASNVSSCITNGDYIPWVQKYNDKALNGGITGADITSIKGTPTILVNGHSFSGDFTKPQDVKAFILSDGKA